MTSITERAKDSEPTGPEGNPHEQSGPSLRLIFGAIAVLTVTFGVLGYRRYANSERYVAEGIAAVQEVGASLDEEGCIDRVVEWHDACDQHDTNAAVCLQGAKLLMFHCLDARDRGEACELYLDPASSKHALSEEQRMRARNPEKAASTGEWVYARCEERGMRCINKRECACAEAYRAIDSFCRTGQDAVQL